MGRLKDAAAPAWSSAGTSRGGRGFVSVSPRRRCPVCGHDSWCQLARDGGVALCKRVGDGGRPKVNRDGVEFYTHRLGPGAARVVVDLPPPTVDRASPEALDEAHRAVLAGLRLDDADRDGLRARGLDDAAIGANGYRTLPVAGRARLARAVVDAVGELAAVGVPGVARADGDDGSAWLTFKGSPGLLIPCRDLAGRVVALKVRRRDPIEAGAQRYLYVTSSRHGGASALSAVHVPAAALAMRGSGAPLVVTEGELKADVAAHLAHRPVLSLPGVGAWRQGLEAVRTWPAERVVVAFDADVRTNPAVASAEAALVSALRAEGVRVEVLRWDGAKGLDDFLRARMGAEVQR